MAARTNEMLGEAGAGEMQSVVALADLRQRHTTDCIVEGIVDAEKAQEAGRILSEAAQGDDIR